jgi:ADP-heptose:LPS heptosyltransferase
MDSNADPRDAGVIARYHRRYGRQDKIFRLFDRVLATVIPRRPATLPSPPRRILLVTAGHIGDVIIATGMLPVLHHAYPGVEIGFLTGSYSRFIVEGHPLVAQTHVIDHWYQSRAPVPRWRRFARYLKMAPPLVRELRRSGYDVAIDLRNWFPNLVPLVWLSAIPIRVGYDRLGFGPLLTHRVKYVYERCHERDTQKRLLRALGVPEASLSKAAPTLTPPSDTAVQEARSLLGNVSRFRVLHPVASVPSRDWRLEHWQSLAEELLRSGISPVITGSGHRDRVIADAIRAAVPGCIDAVNKLSWPGLMALIERAEAVYAVETSVGHAAAALGRPVISIYGGTADPVRFAPLGAAVATKLLPCHPCLNQLGCAGRECILGVTLQDVRDAAQIALYGPRSGHAA